MTLYETTKQIDIYDLSFLSILVCLFVCACVNVVNFVCVCVRMNNACEYLRVCYVWKCYKHFACVMCVGMCYVCLFCMGASVSVCVVTFTNGQCQLETKIAK